MRKPPAVARRLVAAGSYHYYHNDNATGIHEPWSIEQCADGTTLCSAERVSPQHGLKMTVWARSVAGAIFEFNVDWHQQFEKSPLQVSAYYDIDPQRVRVHRQRDEQALEIIELALPASTMPLLVSPLMRVFVGPVIAALIQQGGHGQVLLPFIADPTKGSQLLVPQVSSRQARVLVSSEPAWEGGPTSRCCEYQGDQYPPGTRFWLDEQNVLQRYIWQQDANNVWDVKLQGVPGPTPVLA